MNSVYESKFVLDGIQMPFQCIMNDIPRNSNDFPVYHYHEYIEILYGLDVDADVCIDGTAYRFRTGDLIIINSKENHDLLHQRQDNHYVVIKVLPEILYSTYQSVFESKYVLPFIVMNFNAKRLFTREEIGDSCVRALVSEIMDEWYTKYYGYELLIRSNILKLFLWVLRYWNNHGLIKTDMLNCSDDALRAVQTAIEHIENHYSTATESETAKLCNLSQSYFSRVFNKVMNQSFSSYLNTIRINKAEELLSTSDDTVEEIALSLGYSTSSYFIRQFKEKKGVSPKQFRSSMNLKQLEHNLK
ncbi:MAG: AraC family transcriptional regulator [Acutalibacteraceae bacterium]